MGKIGKSILKQRQTESPPKLTKAEIKELQEYQERMKELAEQRKAMKIEAESETEKIKLSKQEIPSGNVEAKEDLYKEMGPVAERMSSPQPECETEAKPEQEPDEDEATLALDKKTFDKVWSKIKE